MKAAAIAFYHQQTDWPVVQTLVCDDAPQFKLLTENIALCAELAAGTMVQHAQ